MTGLLWFFPLVIQVNKLIDVFHQMFFICDARHIFSCYNCSYTGYFFIVFWNYGVCIAIKNIYLLINFVKNYLRFFIWIIDDKYLDCLSCRVLSFSVFRIRIRNYEPCYSIAQNDVWVLKLSFIFS